MLPQEIIEHIYFYVRLLQMQELTSQVNCLYHNPNKCGYDNFPLIRSSYCKRPYPRQVWKYPPNHMTNDTAVIYIKSLRDFCCYKNSKTVYLQGPPVYNTTQKECFRR